MRNEKQNESKGHTTHERAKVRTNEQSRALNSNHISNHNGRYSSDPKIHKDIVSILTAPMEHKSQRNPAIKTAATIPPFHGDPYTLGGNHHNTPEDVTVDVTSTGSPESKAKRDDRHPSSPPPIPSLLITILLLSKMETPPPLQATELPLITLVTAPQIPDHIHLSYMELAMQGKSLSFHLKDRKPREFSLDPNPSPNSTTGGVGSDVNPCHKHANGTDTPDHALFPNESSGGSHEESIICPMDITQPPNSKLPNRGSFDQGNRGAGCRTFKREQRGAGTPTSLLWGTKKSGHHIRKTTTQRVRRTHKGSRIGDLSDGHLAMLLEPKERMGEQSDSFCLKTIDRPTEASPGEQGDKATVQLTNLTQPMNFIIWNVGGGGGNSANFRCHYEAMVQLHKSVMLVLLETRMAEHKRHTGVLKFES
ncbi:hypothetical protein KY285_007712 [Solanum tuberosum]|nr:hypothetical protein KY285_007712 [Solanum tuberosum]